MDLSWPSRTMAKAGRGARRASKRAAQVAAARPRGAAAPFVLGCQRSGTNMLLRVLDASRETGTYDEYHQWAFQNLRLRDRERIESLVARSRCRWVVFKSICDSQHADRLLSAYAGSRILWIVRAYPAMAASAVGHWGSGQLALMRRLATDETWSHWLAERLPPERRELVRELYGRGLSINSAALKWCQWNELFFDRKLDEAPDRVLLVSYEELVSQPAEQFAEVFEFLGGRFEVEFTRTVSDQRVGPVELADLDERVGNLCDDLTARLTGALQDRRARSSLR